jgi:hypothetical protein
LYRSFFTAVAASWELRSGLDCPRPERRAPMPLLKDSASSYVACAAHTLPSEQAGGLLGCLGLLVCLWGLVAAAAAAAAAILLAVGRT